VLASAKANRLAPWTNDQLRGFNLGDLSGLSILFGPWSDFCLWCWTLHPNLQENDGPTLILAKDNDTFFAQTISPAQDWGEAQVVDTAKIWGASDLSTQNLFGDLANRALNRRVGTKGNVPASQSELDALQKFIAAKRIFIYNVWPWFRCGKLSSNNHGIHNDLSKVPCLWHWVDALLGYLKPTRIAALGGWSYDTALPAPDAWLRRRLGSFTGLIDVFRHPGSTINGWSSQWPTPGKWPGDPYRWGGKANNQAFVDFIP
jgi:hypothetical protein